MTATTPTAITNAAYVDLGAGPLEIQAPNNSYWYQISDTQPAANSAGFYSTGLDAVQIQTTSHVWARSINAGISLLVAPISSIAGTSGGSTTAAGTNGTTAQAVQGINNGVPVTTRTYQPTYQLLSNATATGSTVTGVYGASYIFNVQGTFGSGGTISLQALAADGVTWTTVTSLTANGSVGVVLGANSTVRALVAGTVSAMYASLS